MHTHVFIDYTWGQQNQSMTNGQTTDSNSYDAPQYDASEDNDARRAATITK